MSRSSDETGGSPGNSRSAAADGPGAVADWPGGAEGPAGAVGWPAAAGGSGVRVGDGMFSLPGPENANDRERP